jgi:hypothetical protein
MIGYRTHVVLTLIRQSAGSREDLHDTDHAEEEEHHPDDLVALEEITDSIVHILSLSRVSRISRLSRDSSLIP